ncbi:hypothetical protein HU200_048577 [Digitaria exilis]|uniref:DUF547 domain-containing protein n=1 Tax=Digitaria exilis TaxID=1010633 RepID=A0A835AV23_9POAL|nr:hypothetical protein HU200_048577 [Digitaria exilis]
MCAVVSYRISFEAFGSTGDPAYSNCSLGRQRLTKGIFNFAHNTPEFALPVILSEWMVWILLPQGALLRISRVAHDSAMLIVFLIKCHMYGLMYLSKVVKDKNAKIEIAINTSELREWHNSYCNMYIMILRFGFVLMMLPVQVQALEKRLNDQFVMRRALEKALGYKPCPILSSNESCIPKVKLLLLFQYRVFSNSHSSSLSSMVSQPTEELIKEIAVLELEVICLEQHLLTLYRKAFEQQIFPANSCEMESDKQPARSFSGILSETSELDFSTPRKNQLLQSSRMVLARKSTPTTSTSETSHEKTNIGRSHSSLLHRSVRVSPSANNLARALKPCHTSPLSFVENSNMIILNDQEGKCMDAGIVSLADILGTRVADHVPQTPNKISEDMIKCIAAIYIRLRDVPTVQHAFFPSPCSSFSSASGLSSKYTADIWSPRCRKESFIEAWQENALGNGESRELGLQYDSVVEVSALCKGDQRSADVKDMLRKYMSLVQLLETADLSGMKNEEKLAFWINVHNAMMMHAHIEYGIPQSNSKRILLTKVSYIISGQRVNAELIEYQILCCRAHSSGQWLRLLLYPKWKSRDKDELQGFAVDRPEPLVHFALSSGSYSDPMVRTAASNTPPTPNGARASRTISGTETFDLIRPLSILQLSPSMHQVRLYSPKSLFQQLEAAKEEYIRANAGVRGRGGQHKIILPKALEMYARDAGLGAQEVVAAVERHLPEGLRDAVRRSQQGGRARGRGGGGGGPGVEWRPHNMAFRYLLAKELVGGGSPACSRQLEKGGPVAALRPDA